jgi:hypothetical protein
MNEPAHIAPPTAHRGRWVIWLLGTVLLFMAGFFWLLLKVMGASLGGFGGTQFVAAQYTSKDVVGDLGGMPVTIPRHMAEFVEYEGDPGWGERRQGPVPERTHSSKLTSFGVQFRYPDMATLSSPEMWKDMKSKTMYVTDWMRFSVKTGNNYSVMGALDRRLLATINDGYGPYKYENMQQKKFGMGWYSFAGVDPKTGKPNREVAGSAHDYFFAENDDGKVIAAIRCSNAPHAAAQCRHDFSLEYNGVRAIISIGYRRSLLENWADIQQKTAAMILQFKAAPPQSFGPHPI